MLFLLMILWWKYFNL